MSTRAHARVPLWLRVGVASAPNAYVRPLDVRMSLGRTSHGRASHGRALAVGARISRFRCLRDALRLSRSGILACPYWVGGSWSARPRAETLRPSLPREGAPPFLPYGPVALCAPRQALGVRPSATRHVVESIVTSSSRATLSRAPHDSLTCFPSVRLPYPWGRLVAPTLGPRLNASP